MSRYPDIADYAFVSDCESAALVSSAGSIDWCCMPRVDHGSCFGRLLDWDKGGHCSISPAGDDGESSRRYVEGTLVVETTLHSGGGEARVLDCLTVESGDPPTPHHELLRVVEGVRGQVDVAVEVVPRFDYGEVRPWRRYHGMGVWSAIGGDDGLVVTCDRELEPEGRHDLRATLPVRAGERFHLAIRFVAPHLVPVESERPVDVDGLDAALERTIAWWQDWASRRRLPHGDDDAVVLSALVLKGLANSATGAIAAAPTTSLPESPGGSLNWDYRFSWIRDSAFSVRALADIGFADEADAFRRFIERSAAGSGSRLQIMYGVGGERRLDERELPELEGYRRSAPVRIGNAAAGQLQLDVYGELAELSWRWHERGRSPDDDYWRFILDLVGFAAENWGKPDLGLWEVRGRPKHFVHSKVMCWAALDRGVRLAEASLRQAPLERWKREREAVRKAVEKQGYDERRGVFVQAFDTRRLDAALLLLPAFGFVDWDDERMVRTVDAIREELDCDGLLVRYRRPRGDEQREGAFLACSFWLAECLAHQGRLSDAREVFDRAVSTANDLGLFAEEYDPERRQMLGNFPQGLTHLAHITAASALREVEPPQEGG